jgi:hypothetical protein
MLRRFSWYNLHSLFRRPEADSGKEIFSRYSSGSFAKVFQLDKWNSDSWDPMIYGRDYDSSRSFFEQFRELLSSVPMPAKSVQRMVDSDYCDNAGGFKNCYLCFGGDGFENCAYVISGFEPKDSFDLFEARHSELCYEGQMIDESFRVFYSVNCEESTDVWFSRNLFGCSNCFGCVNLRKKSYYIFNKQYSKEAYERFIQAFQSGSHVAVQAMRSKALAHWLKFPMKFALAINVTNSTGEHIERSKNLKYCYSIHEGENLAYSQYLSPPVSDSYDYTSWGVGASRMYENLVSGEECDRVFFSVECWPGVRDMEYSVNCRSSANLFGCVGLKKKQYCILNKQYTKEEYFKLRERIIAHMNEMPYTDKQGRVYRYGEFFPPEFSPFAYNETIAQDFFPLTKEQAEAKGYLWRESEIREFQATKNAIDLPDNIADVPDDITKEIIKCESCGKAYRIIPMELAFYRRIPLPLPRLCPECRFKRRFKFVNPPKFWHAKCQCAGKKSDTSVYENGASHFHSESHCPNEFETSYAPGRPEIIYCEQCYQAETV